MTTFVDDAQSVVSYQPPSDSSKADTEEKLLSMVQENSSLWAQIVNVAGQKLEISKCEVVPLIWEHDCDGTGTLVQPQQKSITITCPETGKQEHIVVHSASEACKQMGIWSRGDLDEFSHFRYLMEKSAHVAQAVSTSGIRGFHAHLCRSACWIPMLQYSLSATWLSEAQCSQIQQPATRVFLTLMGINRSLPTAIVYGPTHFGCLGL